MNRNVIRGKIIEKHLDDYFDQISFNELDWIQKFGNGLYLDRGEFYEWLLLNETPTKLADDVIEAFKKQDDFNGSWHTLPYSFWVNKLTNVIENHKQEDDEYYA